MLSDKDLNNSNRLSNNLYIGVVTDNNDPSQLSRVKVKIDGLHDNVSSADLPWALQLNTLFLGRNSGAGFLNVPSVGTNVVVMYLKENQYNPIYIGELVSAGSQAGTFEDYPNLYGLFDDAGNFIKINKASTLLSALMNGSVDIEVTEESLIKIGTNSTVEIGENSNVTISGSSTVVISENSDVTISGNSNITVSGNVTANINGSLDCTVGGNTNITSSTNTINGPTTINGVTTINGNTSINGMLTVSSNTTIGGNLGVAGAITFGTGGGGGSMTGTGNINLTGSITSSGDQVAGGISQTGHTHPGVEPGGGTTGTPQ